MSTTSLRRSLKRYQRFRHQSPARYCLFLAAEFLIATAMVYLLMAPLLCR